MLHNLLPIIFVSSGEQQKWIRDKIPLEKTQPGGRSIRYLSIHLIQFYEHR